MATPAAGDWPLPVVLPIAPADGRDAFILWLCSEFAAANAMLDLLLGHLRAGAAAREYDAVAAAVDRRRIHWTSVVNMQQFFPVADVALELRRAAARRTAVPPQRPAARNGARNHAPPPPQDAYEVCVLKDDDRVKGTANSAPPVAENTKEEAEGSLALQSSVNNSPDQIGNDRSTLFPREFSFNALVDGKMVNILQGLKLYNGKVGNTEVDKLVTWANELRSTGHQGGLEGQSFLINRRPMKGHGREVIQLGLPIIDGISEDEVNATQLGGQKVEGIPDMLQDLFDSLVQEDLLSIKPDYCIVDFFNEGDYCHPHFWPSWYGRTVATICLTDCEMVFGRTILGDSRGDHRGPLKLSISQGSLLLHQGRSVGLAKRTIPSSRKERILLTFGRSQPRKSSHEGPAFALSTVPSSNNWVSRPGATNAVAFQRSLNSHIAPMTPNPLGITQVPPDGLQVLFVSSQNAAPATMPFAPSIPAAIPLATWALEAPLIPPGVQASAGISGTGVFIPPSGSSLRASSPPHIPQAYDGENSPRCPAKRLGVKSDGPTSGPGCNGASNGVSNKVQENGAATNGGT